MRRDIDTLRLIVEFCDEIADDILRFGTDIEDFLDGKAYQISLHSQWNVLASW